MKKSLFLAGLAILLAAAGSLSASVVACPSVATIDALEAFNSAANACYSQDKLFWGFNYTPTGAAAPSAADVNASLITQTTPLLDVHGWNFDGNWIASGASTAAFSLGYTIELCSTAPCTGANPGEGISGADATYAPVSVLDTGDEAVSWSNGASTTLTQTSPGPLPLHGDIGLPPGFTGPISVVASFDGMGGITQTSLRFFETTPSSVPEPKYLGALFGALGLAAIAGISRRKRAA